MEEYIKFHWLSQLLSRKDTIDSKIIRFPREETFTVLVRDEPFSLKITVLPCKRLNDSLTRGANEALSCRLRVLRGEETKRYGHSQELINKMEKQAS